MGKKDPRVDAYIAKSADFAKPILIAIRDTVHAACPDVEEDDEMELPAFHVQGDALQHGVVQAALRLRLLEGVARARRVGEGRGRDGALRPPDEASDLPPKKVFAGYVKKAMELNDAGRQGRARSRCAGGEGRRRRPRISRPRSEKQEGARPRSTLHARATNASTSSGSPKRRPRPARGGWRGRRVDGRRQGAQLEVHEGLNHSRYSYFRARSSDRPATRDAPE